MPRLKRSEQFSVDEVCIVHAVQRCVRRAWLAGTDPVSGKDYGYRREIIRRRMEALASVFGIDVLTYAILSNHMHLVLRNRPDVIKAWSDEEVAIRWLKVFPGKRLDTCLGEPTQEDVQQLVNDPEKMEVVRGRLANFSWFMRALSEPIARLANKEDECTGRFWEGRFKLQRITDEAGLLACAMYVDLNPIRAALAEKIEQARHTSAYDRLKSRSGSTIPAAAYDLKPVAREENAELQRTKTTKELKKLRRTRRKHPTRRTIPRDGWLSPLPLDPSLRSGDPQVSQSGLRASELGFLNMQLEDYLQLLRWTAKIAKQTKGLTGLSEEARRRVPKSVKQTLARVGIDLSMWCDLVWNYKRYFGRSSCAGRPETMAKHATSHGRQWVRNKNRVKDCFTPDPASPAT